MTVQGYDKVNYKLLPTRKKVAARGEEHVNVLPTKAAIDYFAGQTKDEQIFDKTERINEEFKEAVRTHTSYPDQYTLPPYYLDCLEELWEDRCNESPIILDKGGNSYKLLEKHCNHGYNCDKINNCTCSSPAEVERNNDIRKEKHRLDNNIKRQPKLTKKQKKHLERWNKEREKFEDMKWGLDQG